MEQYRDEFRIQGKRLQHIEVLNGRKLYIGIKTINPEEKAEKLKRIKADHLGSLNSGEL